MIQPITTICLAAALILQATLATASDRVAIIPLWTTRSLQNVITVSPRNGDFTDPVAALQSITDAGADNPYLVVIGPGEYVLPSPLILKEHVVLAGSGETATRLRGTFASSGLDAASALVLGADNASLRWMTLINSGNGAKHTSGIYFDGVSPEISHVTVKVSGATNNYGIVGLNSTAAIHDSTILATGGSGNLGVAAGIGADLDISNLKISSTGGSDSNYGIFIYTSSPKVANVNITAAGGKTSAGIDGYQTSSTLTNIFATGGSAVQYNYGAYLYDSTPVIRRSTLEGEAFYASQFYGLYIYGGTYFISQSTIIGGVGGTGTRTCVASDNGTGSTLLQNGCN